MQDQVVTCLTLAVKQGLVRIDPALTKLYYSVVEHFYVVVE